MGRNLHSRVRSTVPGRSGRRHTIAVAGVGALVILGTAAGGIGAASSDVASPVSSGRATVVALTKPDGTGPPATVGRAPASTTTTVPVATTTTTAPGTRGTTGTTVPSTTTTTATSVPPVHGGSADGVSAPSTTTTTAAPTTTVPVTPRATRPRTTSTTQAPVPARSTIADNCSTDVSAALDAYLDALPDGAVFTSPPSACYLVNEGVKITHPLGIVGGRFQDDSNTVAAPVPGKPAPSLHPVILIKQASDVTIEGVDLVGANDKGGYHAALVGQTGIDVRSSSNVTIADVTTLDTYGDGLTLSNAAGAGKDDDITVDGLTITRAGRQGITPDFVSGATFSHVDIVSEADSAWDFESDLPQMGTGNITITDSTWNGRINVIEPLTGPLAFDHDSSSGSFFLDDSKEPQLVTVTDSTMLLPANDFGDPTAGIVEHGGTLTFSHDVLGREYSKKAPTGPAWYVNNYGHLTFAHTSVTAPLGSSSGGAVVTISH